MLAKLVVVIILVRYSAHMNVSINACCYLSGYNQVVVLPKGAFNIKISQQSQTGDEEDDNYLGKYYQF